MKLISLIIFSNLILGCAHNVNRNVSSDNITPYVQSIESFTEFISSLLKNSNGQKHAEYVKSYSGTDKRTNQPCFLSIMNRSSPDKRFVNLYLTLAYGKSFTYHGNGSSSNETTGFSEYVRIAPSLILEYDSDGNLIEDSFVSDGIGIQYLNVNKQSAIIRTRTTGTRYRTAGEYIDDSITFRYDKNNKIEKVVGYTGDPKQIIECEI